jgi:hypothetical protein
VCWGLPCGPVCGWQTAREGLADRTVGDGPATVSKL